MLRESCIPAAVSALHQNVVTSEDTTGSATGFILPNRIIVSDETRRISK
jgi:hypothetical protein